MDVLVRLGRVIAQSIRDRYIFEEKSEIHQCSYIVDLTLVAVRVLDCVRSVV
jgi:hypothetical protein